MQRFTLTGLYDPQKKWFGTPEGARAFSKTRWRKEDRDAALADAGFLARYADGKPHVYLLGHRIKAYRFPNPTEFSDTYESYFTRSSLEREIVFEEDLGNLLTRELPFPENEFLSVIERQTKYGRGYEIQLHAPTVDTFFGFQMTQREVIDGEKKWEETHTFTPKFDKATKMFTGYQDAPGLF